MPIHATLIAENYAGLLSQGKGLADRAGFSWDFQPIIFRKKTFISRFLFRFAYNFFALIDPIIISPQTDVIISVGGKGSRVAVSLAKKHKIPIIQIQNPRMSLRDFSLVIVNEHDRIKGGKIVTIRTALHGVSPEKLLEARRKWQGVICPNERKVLGVLLGGPNGRHVFGKKEAIIIAEQIKNFIAAHHMSCVITPSRRTSPEIVVLMKTLLQDHDVRFLSGESEENPYLGILACSDCLAVTEDSVSMISEAIATTCPVGILPLSGQSSRLELFVKRLEQTGRISPFNVNMSLTLRERLDDTPLAVEKMKQQLRE